MAIADVVMVGRYDTAALAALSLGYAVSMPLLRHRHRLHGRHHRHHRARQGGSGSPDDAGDRAARPALGAGRSARSPALLCLLAGPVLRLVGQAPGARRRRRGGRADASRPGTLFQIVFVAASFYLEGTGRPGRASSR